jgi:hypothetical protein
MSNEIDPIVGSWYQHLDKGQDFMVVAFDEESGLVEIQHFDGDIEEVNIEEWYQLNLDTAEEPENWSGAMDIGTKDDYGTEITDTESSEWSAPLDEIHLRREGREKASDREGEE